MMSETGTVTEVGGPYAGMDRFVARKAIVRDLEASGRLLESRDAPPRRSDIATAAAPSSSRPLARSGS